MPNLGVFHPKVVHFVMGPWSAAAHQAVDRLQPPEADVRSQRAIAMLKADILLAAGHRDSARTIVEDLLNQVPTSARYKAKLDSLKG